MEATVIRWILTILCSFVISAGALCFSASAQVLPISGCVTQTQFCPSCGDPGTGFFNCVQEITILDICNVMLPSCAPSAAPQETHSKCPACGQPISLADGNTYIEQT